MDEQEGKVNERKAGKFFLGFLVTVLLEFLYGLWAEGNFKELDILGGWFFGIIGFGIVGLVVGIPMIRGKVYKYQGIGILVAGMIPASVIFILTGSCIVMR